MKNRRTSTVQRILGFLIAGASLMMIPPALVSWWYKDGTAELFLVSAVILFLAGMTIFMPVRHVREELRLRDGFLVVVACCSVCDDSALDLADTDAPITLAGTEKPFPAPIWIYVGR